MGGGGGRRARSKSSVECIGPRGRLVAGGRTSNTDGIGLETAGVETDERRHVKVNERLQTTAQDVWAVGDCAGSPYLTHIGMAEGLGALFSAAPARR